MKSKLFFVPFIALMVIGISVNAQDKKKTESAMDQSVDRYQQQKKAEQATFKRDMDALNDQKNLTPAQKEAKRKQITATFQQQKKANQEALENSKATVKNSRKEAKEADKIEDRNDKKMKEKHESRGMEHHENKMREHKEHHESKPAIAHKEHH